MIASGSPATHRGSSGGEGASGFGGLLAELRQPEGDEAVASPERPTTRPGLARRNPMDDGSGHLILPGAVEAKEPEREVLPGTAEAKDAEPLVLPGAPDVKPPEPQILPGTPAKDAEPLILPGTVTLKEPEPQVLPGSGGDKAPDPLVLPDNMATKGVGPQVLPGATDGKTPQPQVLPGPDSAELALPVPRAGDAADVAEQGTVRPQAGHAQTHALQPVPPPLRALAERTSKPLDDAPNAPSPSAADAKTASPTTSPVSAHSDQAGKAAPQAIQAPTTPQADRSAAAPEEGPSSGGSTAGPNDAAAPARDHSLSTLSRASIDATAQIAAQIQRRLEGRSTRFEIALRPAELGRVDVKLDIDAEGRLAARLAFDNPAAATDLRGRVDDLRRQLEAAGFDLAEDAFEFAERDSGSSAFDRGQDARHGQNRAFAAAARLKTEIDVAQPPQWLALSLSPSGVDMKV